MLKLENLYKRYDISKPPAVFDLSLEVEDGEIFGFIGPNGAGKSTTIKMLTGILPPDRGSVILDGIDLEKDPLEYKKKFGYVPDNPDIYEKLTGIEYLNFLGDVYDVPEGARQERIEKYTEMFEISGALRDRIKSYSHGMRQKIVITGALIHQPKLWVLDEPMVGLDPMSAHKLKEEMKAHCQRGNMVFFSTHVLEVAQKLCHRVGIINEGELLATGTIEQLRSAAGGTSGDSLEEIFIKLVSERNE